MVLRADWNFDIIIVARWGRDAELMCQALGKAGIPSRIGASVGEVAGQICERADTLIIVEEVLDAASVQALATALRGQPPWSDLPIIVLTGGGAASAASAQLAQNRQPLGNVALIERPVRAITLISYVQSALRARQKQYEIRQHLEELSQAEEKLRRSHEKLETQVAERTASLRRLSARLLRAQDEERRRIARELHDSLGQYLAGLAMQIEQLGQGSNPEILDEARKTLEICITETRTLSHLLHPPLLDEVGLTSAMKWYVEGFSKRSGIKVQAEIPAIPRLDKGIETMVFRVLQESLTNIHRHSGTKSAEVALECSDDEMILAVKDHGRGMSQQLIDGFHASGGAAGGVGLAGMRERINETGGRFLIESGNHGTLVKVTIPLRWDAKSE
jgi:signal transduction histidine kinase